MVRTMSQVLTRALADVDEGRHVALDRTLTAALAGAPAPQANGSVAEVALVAARAITRLGEIDVAPPARARETWAILSMDAERGGFVEALPSAPTARVTRIYHPLAIAEVHEFGLLLLEVVRGTSARDAARTFGVPCFAGPDLCEWRESSAQA